MPTYIDTLTDKSEQNYVLPRTVLKAIADDNGNYLDNQLTASDINALKGGVINSVVTHTDDLIGGATPVNADQLNGHADTYFSSADSIAPVEVSPATSAHSVGDIIMFNSKRYKVTSAIAINDNLVVGTNIQLENVEAAISSLSTIKEATLTMNYGGTGKAYRVGNLVTITLSDFCDSSHRPSISSDIIVASIPSGYKPIATIATSGQSNLGNLNYDTGFFYVININGYVSTYTYRQFEGSGGQVHATYITNDPMPT